MKRLRLGLAGLLAALALAGWWSQVSQAAAPPQETATTWAEPARRTAVGHEGWQISYSQAYTIYLPIILTPPPPSPKKGVGMARPPACEDMELLRVPWYFRWSPFPDPTCSGVDERFVPRISTAADMTYLAQAIANAGPSGWLIGFTEPNLETHANLTPAQAAVLWRQIEQAADPAGIKLVSPSPSQHEPVWLWDMVNEYRTRYGHNPRFDAMGWNIYRPTAGEIQSYLTARRNEALTRGYNVPIWVLEYGGHCQGTMASNEALMQAITPWFDNTAWIGRYAWFANRLGYLDGYSWHSCSLININTNVVTPLGSTYQGF